MAIEFDGLIPQGADFAHSVLTTFDPCVVSCTMPMPKVAKVPRPKLSKAKGASEQYRSSGISKYNDMVMVSVFDPDDDYDPITGSLIGDTQDGIMTWTLPKKDEDNAVPATIVYGSAWIMDGGDPTFDYNNEATQVEHNITWAVSDYSQTDEAVA